MPVAQELPTEILCTIFELSATSVAGSHTQRDPQSPSPNSSSASTPAANSTVSPSDINNFCALPSQKDLLLHCISLSHVCVRWRYAAISLHTLWTEISLGPNAFVSKDYNDVKAMEMTSLFLSRSVNLPLCLDITFALDAHLLPLSWIQKSRYEENIRRALLPHVGRFRSLRLMSNEVVITAVLDVFLERNLSSSPKDLLYTPLSHLHLMQLLTSANTNTGTMTNSAQPFFPPDLSLITPHLTTLRIDGVQVAAFPRWSLQYVALTDTFLSYQNHFHLFMKTRTSKLVLHRVTIPGGIPYVRRLLQQNQSSITILSLSELQCAGPENEHQDMYMLFFTLSICRTLQELELSGLSMDAMVGLVVMLGASPLVIFVGLRRLVLRGIEINITAAEVMAIAFPSVSEMVLERVKGGSELVYDLWQGNIGVWPQLVEIMVDGEPVIRHR